MDRAWKAAALGTPPVLPGSFSHGYATPGDPSTSTPATQPGAWWFHMITEELYGCLVAAGLTPDPSNLSQLARATVQFLQSGTGAVLRTQQDKLRDVVHIKDFGAVCDGVVDDTAAIQAAATAAGGKQLRISGTPKITAAITLLSNTEVVGDFGAVIQTATADISFLLASGKTNVHVRGIHFKQTAAGNTAYTAGVKLLNSSHCSVNRCEFEGMQWSGIHLDGATDCDIYFNYVHDSLASTAGDKFDLVAYRSHRNNIGYNRFVGGQNGGVLIQDPAGSGINVPTRNKVFRNMVGSSTIACKTYGMVLYLGGTAPTYNEFTHNDIENVLGDPAVQASTGSGLYFVGTGLGGCKADNNNVRNCCQLTTSATNGPAAIAITESPDTECRVSVSGNTIEACVQGHGLLISGCGSVVANGNMVTIPSANNGAGPGVGALAGNALKIINSDNVSVNGGRYICHGSQDSVFTFATDANHSDIILSGVTSTADTGCPFRTAQSGGFTITGYEQIGCNGTTTGSGGNAAQLSALVDSSVVGGRYSSGAQAALSMANCLTTRVSAARWASTGTIAVSSSGTCTGSFIDKSNYWGTSAAAMDNEGTGCNVEWRSNAMPTAGHWIQGDWVQQSAYASGSPVGWGRLTSGAGNVLNTDWKAGANL